MREDKFQGRNSLGMSEVLFEQPALPVALLDGSLKVQRVSRGLADLLATSPDHIQQTSWMDWVAVPDRAAVKENLEALTSGDLLSKAFECRYVTKSADLHWCSTASFALRSEGQRSPDLLLFLLEVAGKMQLADQYRELERQFLSAQKMESLGLLVGGIAHDFNNFLEVILGFASLARLRVLPDSDLHEPLQMIEESARKASELTSRLLNLIREDETPTEAADLNQVLDKVLKIIRRTFDRKIQIKAQREPHLPWVRGDARRLEQALLNLAINARDAMPEGGTLKLEAALEGESRTESLHSVQIPAGDYVRITVEDTGTGMDPSVLRRIFDPLFTTKPPGEGTGLGLTMVQKVVRDCGGTIEVKSEVGEGSSFVLRLPLATRSQPLAEPAAEAPLSKGRGTVLVVEDEPMVLAFVERGLRQLGYTVLTATTGKKACEMYARDPDRIDCVLLDMIMPEMSGLEAYARLKAIRPDVRVILSSGYGRERFRSDLPDVDFLGKPYSLEALSQAIGKIRNE